jgi:hypothetical protein
LKPSDLIDTARHLAHASARGRPREANLRRAVSTAYYALFHCLAACCADMLVGGSGARRSQPAWRQVYRALQHGPARKRCERRAMVKEFPSEIQNFASLFVLMQKERHRADYDPDAAFYKTYVRIRIAQAAILIKRFNRVPTRDRRAFAVYVLLDIRGD